MNKLIGLILFILSSLATFGGAVFQQTGQDSIFTVSGSDILETSVSSVADGLTLNGPENTAAGGNTSAVLNNGVFGAADKTESVVIASGTITFHLDTSENIFGYDIDAIHTYAGWADLNRGSQAYTVSYSKVGDAGFTDILTVSMNPDGYTQEEIAITDSAGGLLASGVDAIRFTFPYQQFGGVGYKELDVLGAASSPAVTQEQTGQNAVFTVSSTDLLESSLSSSVDDLVIDVGNNTWAGGHSSAVLNNGVFGAADETESVVIESGVMTYYLDVSSNVDGYDIHAIETYAGWADHNRGSQAYTVSFSYTGDDSFYDLDIVRMAPDIYTQEKYVITRHASGVIATRVDAIRFTFPTQQYNGVGYKELDVLGSPSSSLTLADVVGSLYSVNPPMRGSTSLELPSVPSGFDVAIKSSSLPGVIATDGTINPPATNTVVDLVLTVTDLQNSQTADTQLIHLFVPSSVVQAPFVSYTENFSMRRGLFVHWGAPPDGIQNNIVFSDGTRSTTVQEFAADVDVPAVVSEIASLGFEYVIMQNFHGYHTTLNPCAALDSWRTQGCTATRDMIGELIAALKLEGIPVYLFTHPLDGYDAYSLVDQDRVGWYDPDGGYQRWNDFVNDVYAELTERYGDDIAGFGFDSEFGESQENTYSKLDLKRLRETILSRRPHLSLHGLAGPNDTIELGMKEVWRPSWLDPWPSYGENDYNVENWPAYRRCMGIVQGYHWATIFVETGMARLTGAQMFRYGVLQAGVSTEGPGVAWAASPYTDGTWENGVGPAFSTLEALTQPVRESLAGVLPSTSYPLEEGVRLSTLPHGVVATRSLDDAVEYIHVMNPPAGSTLTLPLPEDGKQFTAATLLSNGNTVQLTTNATDLSLTLGAGDSWDVNDTVIKLLVDLNSVPVQNLAFNKKVEASTSVQHKTTAWGPIHLVDGVADAFTSSNGWSRSNYGYSSEPSASNRAEWITVDLEQAAWVSEFRLHPRNDSGNVGYGYPVDFEISTSTDGVNWVSVVTRSSEPLPTVAQSYVVAPQYARYIRIDATQLRSNPNDSGRYSFQLVELEVFGNNAPIADPQSVTTNEDVATAITLSGSDPDGHALTYEVVTQPANGTLSGAAPNLTYTPDAGYYGSDSFIFKVDDGAADSAVATIDITVNMVNHAPVADTQSVTTDEDVSTAITLTSSDPDNDPLTYVIVSQPTNGTLSGTAPNLTYTPTAGYYGSDSFTFKVNDGVDDSPEASVSIAVNKVAALDVIVSCDNSYELYVNGALTLTGDNWTVAQSLNNLVLQDGENVVAIKAMDAGGAGGIAALIAELMIDGQRIGTSADWKISLTGPTGWSDVSFDDSSWAQAIEQGAYGVSPWGTLVANMPSDTPAKWIWSSDAYAHDIVYFRYNINVASGTLNWAPVANNQNVVTDEDVATAITLTGSDADSDPLTYDIVTQPANGTLLGTAPNLTYTPGSGFIGNDSFTFKVNDGNLDSEVATVDITVNQGNSLAPGLRVTEYYLTTGDFSGTTASVTLNQDLEDDYFILVRGSRVGDGISPPDNDYARVISVPGGKGDLSDSGAANQIGLQRQASDHEWEGVVTVVECANAAGHAGFRLIDVVVTTMTTTSGSSVSAAWSDLSQVVLFGGYRGGGVELFGDPSWRAEGTGAYTRIYPSGTETIHWERDAGGELLHNATMTTFVVEWGAEWSVQYVNVSGVAGGDGANDTNEYTTAAISPVSRDATWVWGAGTRVDAGIGDCAEACLVTLGDGVSQNTTESTVAVGSEYTDAYDFDVYVMSHPALAVDHRFKADGDSTAADLAVGVDVSVNGARFGWCYNGVNGTGIAFPRPRMWARFTGDGTVTISRGYSGQAFPAWVQAVDFSGVNQ